MLSGFSRCLILKELRSENLIQTNLIWFNLESEEIKVHPVSTGNNITSFVGILTSTHLWYTETGWPGTGGIFRMSITTGDLEPVTFTNRTAGSPIVLNNNHIYSATTGTLNIGRLNINTLETEVFAQAVGVNNNVYASLDNHVIYMASSNATRCDLFNVHTGQWIRADLTGGAGVNPAIRQYGNFVYIIPLSQPRIFVIDLTGVQSGQVIPQMLFESTLRFSNANVIVSPKYLYVRSLPADGNLNWRIG